jgi:hypothetical protein
MNPRPCDNFGDLGGPRLTSDHRQIRDPHQNLKFRSYNVEVPGR